MRILCLDIGTKRIGVAASDPMGWTAQGVGVVERRGGVRAFDDIARICGEIEPGRIVVGLPLDEEGSEGPAAKRVRDFTARLVKHLRGAGIDVPIEMWDERYSTSVAESRLIEADVSRAGRKKVIDKMAAAVILEDYLAAHAPQSLGDESAEG